MKPILSETETKVLKCMGTRKTTLGELSKKFWFKKRKPANYQNIMSNTVGRLTVKAEFYRLPFAIQSERKGKEKVIWKTPRFRMPAEIKKVKR